MRGVILAGGKGTRLLPATRVTNKHLIPLGPVPMIEFPLRALKRLGVKDIILISGGDHIGGFAEYLGDGSDFGVALTYRVQKEAGGIAQAFLHAEDFCRGEQSLVILGDNIFDEDLLASNPTFLNVDNLAHIVLKNVESPKRFGVAQFDGNKRLVGIIEKPEMPPSPYAVTGLYRFPPDVFGIIKTLKPSLRGELEITDVNNHYVREGRMNYSFFEGFWSDAGTPKSLFRVYDWLKNKYQ